MPEMRLTVHARFGANAADLGAEPGAPIVGGTVEAVTTGLPRIITSSTTGADGRAELSVAEPGTYAVHVTFNVDGGAFLGDTEVAISEPEHSLHVECRAFEL